MFQKLLEGIYLLKVPFEDLDTAVFWITDGENGALLDSASSKEDVKTYILPALKELGATPDWLLCSHLHGDHAGGTEELFNTFPNAKIGLFAKENPFSETYILKDGELLFNRFCMLNLKGHCDDALAVLDTKTKALITCDCLQLCGVGTYATSFTDVAMYQNTLNRVKALHPKYLFASHDYVPLGREAVGEKAVQAYVAECENAVKRISAFAKQYPTESAEEIAKKFWNTYPDLPPVYPEIVTLLRNEETK